MRCADLVHIVGNDKYVNTPLQRQTAVTAYFPSKQLLLFVFARQYANNAR